MIFQNEAHILICLCHWLAEREEYYILIKGKKTLKIPPQWNLAKHFDSKCEKNGSQYDQSKN